METELNLFNDMKILEENVREKCVYQVINDNNGAEDLHLFFNYLYNVRNECINGDNKIEWLSNCASKVLREVGVNHQVVE